MIGGLETFRHRIIHLRNDFKKRLSCIHQILLLFFQELVALIDCFEFLNCADIDRAELFDALFIQIDLKPFIINIREFGIISSLIFVGRPVVIR